MATTKKTTKTVKKVVKAATKKATAPKKEVKAKKPITLKEGEALIYDLAGKSVGSIALPPQLFGQPTNNDLIHSVSVGMQVNARVAIANSKDRSEVRGGGKKPWKQKGTGRARHGSSRSPIWKGGGTTHGPRKESVYTVKLNRKVKSRALASLLSTKLRAGEVIFVDSLAVSSKKTKDAVAALSSIAKGANLPLLVKKNKNAALLALSGKNPETERTFRNISNLALEDVRNLNVVDVLNKKYLVIENPTEAVATLMKKFTSSNA